MRLGIDFDTHKAKLESRIKEMEETLFELHNEVRKNPTVTGSKGSQVANPVLRNIAPLENSYRSTLSELSNLRPFGFGSRKK